MVPLGRRMWNSVLDLRSCSWWDKRSGHWQGYGGILFNSVPVTFGFFS